jgi:hypothetical protein
MVFIGELLTYIVLLSGYKWRDQWLKVIYEITDDQERGLVPLRKISGHQQF